LPLAPRNIKKLNWIVTFDGFIETVSVFPDGQVGRVTVGPPKVDALVFRAGGDVFPVRALKRKNKLLSISGSTLINLM
jgi:hypothetical protein